MCKQNQLSVSMVDLCSIKLHDNIQYFQVLYSSRLPTGLCLLPLHPIIPFHNIFVAFFYRLDFPLPAAPAAIHASQLIPYLRLWTCSCRFIDNRSPSSVSSSRLLYYLNNSVTLIDKVFPWSTGAGIQQLSPQRCFGALSCFTLLLSAPYRGSNPGFKLSFIVSLETVNGWKNKHESLCSLKNCMEKARARSYQKRARALPFVGP